MVRAQYMRLRFAAPVNSTIPADTSRSIRSSLIGPSLKGLRREHATYSAKGTDSDPRPRGSALLRWGDQDLLGRHRHPPRSGLVQLPLGGVFPHYEHSELQLAAVSSRSR